METVTFTREEFKAEIRSVVSDIMSSRNEEYGKKFREINGKQSDTEVALMRIDTKFGSVERKLNAAELDFMRVGHRFGNVESSMGKIRSDVSGIKQDLIWLT